MSDYLIAEAGIRRLHARYADAVFRKDYVSFAECFTPDAQWLIVGRTLHGPGEIVAFLEARMARFHWVLMTFGTPLLELGQNSATGRTYVTEQSAAKDGQHTSSVATYYERFHEQNGEWKRSWAMFQLHYLGPADLSGTFFPQTDYGPPPAMPPVSQ